jgi:hypothetical protein
MMEGKEMQKVLKKKKRQGRGTNALSSNGRFGRGKVPKVFPHNFF